MTNSSENLQRLISELKDLPGIGWKSAGRLAYFIANAPKEKVRALSDAIINARENIKHCSICYTLSDDDICSVCKNENRDHKTIMVVENERDMLAYENTGKYNGVYHVLGGVISPLIGIGPNELKIKELASRLSKDVNEVIIATNSSIEGETTASYIAKLIKPFNITVTRIASGVPAGSDIENVDEVTLLHALKGRQKL